MKRIVAIAMTAVLGSSLLCSLPLLAMDTKKPSPSLPLIFSSIQVLHNERHIDLADINNVRCLNKAAYRYYSIPTVFSFPQFHLKTDPSAYSMRGSILMYCAKKKKKETDCAKHKKKELFSKLWDIDHHIRDVDISVSRAKDLKHVWALKSYTPEKAMRKYRQKKYRDASRLKKRQFQLLLLIIGRDAGRYQQMVLAIAENFKTTHFNIFDIKDECTEKEKKWLPYVQLILSSEVPQEAPELLLAVMGGVIDPRSFLHVAKIGKERIISFLLKNCFNDFFTIDEYGRGLFHYMCECLNDTFVSAFISEAVLQNRTVNLQLQDSLGNSPLDLLWAHKYDSDRRKKNEILACLESYSGMDLNITQSDGSSNTDDRADAMLAVMLTQFFLQNRF